MKKTIFDVLIVYSSCVADSASSSLQSVVAPFGARTGCELYNDVYGYLMAECQKLHIKIAFTTSADIIGSGLCASYWLFKKNCWIKVNARGYARVVFDKVSPTSPMLTKQRNLLFSSPKVKPFNNPSIHAMFIDKLKTYASLGQFAIPTIQIRGTSLHNVQRAGQELQVLLGEQSHLQDFSDEVIVKDQLGSSGNLIYKFAKDQYSAIARELQLHKHKSFILQPFMKFDKGYTHHGIQVAADIRLIYLRGKIIQTYIRIAKKDTFLCNYHQGGTLEYLKQTQIPQVVRAQAKNIMHVLKNNMTLFALDFVVSNDGNAYFLEGNTGPGLDWNPNILSDIGKSKELMRMIAVELARRSKIFRVLRVKKAHVRELLPKLSILQPEATTSFLVV